MAIALETSRGPVISALLSYDFIVLFPVNPKALNNYRAAFSVSGAKDDRCDAMLLEEYVRLHWEKLKALEPDTVETRTLAGLVETRRNLVDERTRLVEQLHSVLKTYYPLAEALLGKQMTKPMVASHFQGQGTDHRPGDHCARTSTSAGSGSHAQTVAPNDRRVGRANRKNHGPAPGCGDLSQSARSWSLPSSPALGCLWYESGPL